MNYDADVVAYLLKHEGSHWAWGPLEYPGAQDSTPSYSSAVRGENKGGEGDRSKQLGTFETCHSDSFDCFCWEGAGTSLVALQGVFAWPSDLANLKMPSARFLRDHLSAYSSIQSLHLQLKQV